MSLAGLSFPVLQARPPRAKPDLSVPVLVSDPAHITGEQHVAVGPEGQVYLVWGGGPLACTGNVYFARSTDGGQSFSAPKNLSQIPCDSFWENAYNPKLAVDVAGTVYVVWDRVGPGGPPPNQVYFTRSTDGGQTFTAPKNVSHSPPVMPSFGAVVPDLAASGPGEVWVAWLDRYDQEQLDQVFVSHSIDGGDTFSPPLQVSFRPEGWSGSTFPGLTVDAAGRGYISWVQPNSGAVDALLSRSTDGGATFSLPVDLSQGLGISMNVALAAEASDRVFAAWTLLETFWETWFRSSVDGGATFSPPRRISRRRHGASLLQAIAVGRPGQVCIAWHEVDKGSDILARCSFDGGETFRRRFNASGPLGWQQGDIALDAEGNLYVVFGGDLRSINPDAWWTGVYFRRSLEPLQ